MDREVRRRAPYRFDDALRERMVAHLGRFRRRSVPDGEGRRRAAVALVVVGGPSGEAALLITRRAPSLRSHGGQWALPGGVVDPEETPSEAALRELHEELGLELGHGNVLGLLDDYPTRSGFVITPVVVWGAASPRLVPNPEEVARVHNLALGDLDAPGRVETYRIPESTRPVLALALLGQRIHAPTAALLLQFREVTLRGSERRVDHFEQPVFAWR